MLRKYSVWAPPRASGLRCIAVSFLGCHSDRHLLPAIGAQSLCPSEMGLPFQPYVTCGVVWALLKAPLWAVGVPGFSQLAKRTVMCVQYLC